MDADRPEPERRYATLDAWRGLACLPIVALHAVGRYVDDTHEGPLCAPLRWIDRGGWIGVPLFFVISGFCIAASARRIASRPAPRALFFRRRLRRIYPTYLAALAFAALVSMAGDALRSAGVENGAAHTTDLGWHWVGNLLLLESPLSLLGIEPRYLFAPAWSLCIEEQFYVFVALAFLATTPRVRAGALVAMSLVGIALALTVEVGAPGVLPQCWPAFALGIWLHERPLAGPRGRRAWDAWAVLTALGMGLAYTIAAGRVGQDAKQIAICAGFALLLAALRPFDASIRARRPVAALAWVGERSYSIYLLHFPVVIAIGDTVYPFGWTRGGALYATAAASSAIAIGLAIPFHAFVERRFRDGRTVASAT